MITPGRFKDIEEKGVSHMFLERDEHGYFYHVYSIHLFSYENQIIKLNEKHTILEFGGKYRLLYHFGLISTWGLLTCVDAFPHIYQRIITERNSVIRATDPSIDGFYGLILGWVMRVPWCVSIHADFDKRHMLAKGLSPQIFGSRKLAKILERFVLSHAPVVMPIRESLGDWAIKNGANPKSIRIIPHGVDTDQYIGNRNSNIQEKYGVLGKKLIVFAGRLSKDNYVEDIIDTAIKVIQKNPEAIFLLIGDGPEKGNLLKKITEFNIANNVKILGFLPYDTVIEFRMRANVNICLMGGFSLIESALSGKPTLAYDVEWHSELIKNGETGYLIKERDIDGVADAILELLSNPPLSERLGGNARRLAIERHSLKNTSKIKIKCYDELLQMSNR